MASEKKSMVDHMRAFGPQPMGPPPTVKDRRGTMRRLWRYLAHYRAGLAGIALLVLLSSALALVAPYLLSQAIDHFIIAGDLRGLARMVLLLLVIYLLNSTAVWVQSISMIRIAQQTVCDLRHDVFEKMQQLPLRYFDRHQHGEMMSRVTNDTDTISATLGDSVAQLISSVLMFIGAGSLMFYLNWRLALTALVTFPLVLLVTRWVAARSRRHFRERQQAIGALNGLIEETVIGQRVVKACRRETQVIAAFAVLNDSLRRSASSAMIYSGLMGPMMTLFRNLGFAVLAAVGGWLVVTGHATIGLVVAFMNYSDYFNRPLMQLASLYSAVQAALAGAERVFAVIDEAPETGDAPDAIELTDVRGDVEFAQVNFSYNPEVPVLSEVSFQAAAGQTVAFVGATGAGKTTIINLLTRFYEIDAGEIRVDGHDIRRVRKQSLRRALGIVLQDTVLFAGPVRENIRYGKLDAGDAEVEAAARLANADSFIRHLPHGYDTLLSEDAGSLSQGQRQLLAIARAMLADPAILILDEATSSVDTRTEIHIQQAMHRLKQGRTSFVIAHRLRTIREADLILVLEAGRIVERGTHDQLLEQRGAYYRLYHSQFPPEEMRAAS